MANRERGEASLNLASGKTLTLAVDNNALCELEEQTDRNASEVLTLATKGRVSASRALLWAATRRHHPDMTLLDCGTLLDTDRDAIVAAIGSALEGAFGEPEAMGDKEPGKASRGSSGTKPGAKPV